MKQDSYNEPTMFAWVQTSDESARWEIGSICTFGRPSEGGPQNTVEIDLEYVSRRHAFIHRQRESEFVILDAGSADGTYINNRLIIAPTPLFDGDRILIGDVEFVFHQPGNERQATGQERPQMTVFRFRRQQRWLIQVDHARYTPFTTQNAPLEVAQVVWPWYREARSLVEECGGLVNQFLGDGILASFPDSTPPEQLANATRRLRVLPGAASLSIRVVVHYGEVAVAGALHSQEMMGQAMNFLSRMEKLARDLGLDALLSEAVAERLGECFPQAASVGEFPLAGFPGTHRFYSI